MPEKAWINCSGYTRVLNMPQYASGIKYARALSMPQYSYNNIIIIIAIIIIIIVVVVTNVITLEF